MFKMDYGIKIPCPSCKEVLRVLPDQSLFVGIPLATFKKSAKNTEDKTIRQEQKIITFSIKVDEDKTVLHHVNDPALMEDTLTKRKPSLSYPSIQSFSLAVSCVLFLLSVFFIFKNEKTISMVQQQVAAVSERQQENNLVEDQQDQNIQDHESELTSMQQDKAYESSLEESSAIGGLKDETATQMSMTEEQLLNVKKTKNDLQILYLPSLGKVTSSYGVRLDPFTKKLAFHGGIDFKAKTGSNVHAALDGTVEYAGRKGLYGNVVILKHKKGYKTLYAHLQKTLVKKGEQVSRKDVIGLAGTTGRSTGPHLHFELHHKGKKKDPLQADLIPKG
ncbi:MAG: M23 family metallopeptidase [Deltaproteobacteria bacterium]|nr:M23 family metallopeptidase [Deltaproteobacteria bacterium]